MKRIDISLITLILATCILGCGGSDENDPQALSSLEPTGLSRASMKVGGQCDSTSLPSSKVIVESIGEANLVLEKQRYQEIRHVGDKIVLSDPVSGPSGCGFTYYGCNFCGGTCEWSSDSCQCTGTQGGTQRCGCNHMGPVMWESAD